MKNGFYILKEGECAFAWFANLLISGDKCTEWDETFSYHHHLTDYAYPKGCLEEKKYQYHLPHELFT